MGFRKSLLPLLGIMLGAGFAAQAQAQSSPSAFTTGYRYDAARRLVGTIAPDPDAAGSLHYPATRNTYDQAGRLTRVETGELATWQPDATAPANWAGFTVLRQVDTSYDVLDRKILESVSSGGTTRTVTQTSYDLAGRVDCVAVRMNPETWWALPAACTLTTGSNGSDRITRNVYDAAGQLTQVRKAVGTNLEQAYATYRYTPNGQQDVVVDANGNRAERHYDGLDRQDRWTFPAQARPSSFDPSTPDTALATSGAANPNDYEAYGYDANNDRINRTSLKKRDGAIIAYQYDALNRLTLKTVPTSATGAAGYAVAYSYDNRGLQLSAAFTSSGQGVTNGFDNAGRLTSTVSTMGGASVPLIFGYDQDGNRTSIRHADGQGFDTYWDGLDRFNYLYQASGPQIARTVYDQAGQLSVDARNGAARSFGYDGVGRLTSIWQDLAGTSYDQNLAFSFNPASQIVGRTRSNAAYEFTEAAPGTKTYAVNGLNQYLTNGTASFAYDANGNLSSDGANTYVYDAENRLVSVSGVNNVTLAYDPFGRLWQQSAGGTSLRFYYDGDQLVEERDGAGSLLKRYAHAPGEDVPLLEVTGPTMSTAAFRHLVADERGSIVAVTDWTGNLINGIPNTYDEWGVPGANNQGRFQYTGQVWLPALGLYYYKARMYSSRLGRFLQTDPIGYKDHVNLYAYVGNDPVDGRDPTGNSTLGTIGDIALGFVPIVGDALNIRDAYKDPSAVNIAVAVVGIVPELGEVGAIRRAVQSISRAERVAARAGKTEVHHIVPHRDSRAAAAQDNMRDKGINPRSDASNKVAISGDRHDITRRDSYVQETNARIANQPDAASIRQECCKIADELRNSTRDELDKRYPPR